VSPSVAALLFLSTADVEGEFAVLIRSDHGSCHAAGDGAGLNGYIGGVDTNSGTVGQYKVNQNLTF